MLLIACPWCGERGEVEFAHGGDATPERPEGDEPFGAAWMDYVYLRDNPRGLYLEYWQHVHGCRRWFKALRDTATNRIHATGTDITMPQGEE